MNVARRPDDGISAARGTTVHIRSMYTLCSKLGRNRKCDIESEMVLWKRKLIHSNVVEYLGIVQVSEANLRLLSVSSSLDLGMRIDKLFMLGKQIPVTDISTLLNQAIAGLSHLHHNGIVVGTLHPGRFILDSTGVLRVSDFLHSAFLPFVDKCVGSERQQQRYVAPEIPLSVKSTWGVGGEPADSWSTGVTFIELLCAPHCPWRSSGVASFNEAAVNMTKSQSVADFSNYCKSFRSDGSEESETLTIVPASFHECLEKLRRRHGAEQLLTQLCRMTRSNPHQRATPVCLDEELNGQLVSTSHVENVHLRCEQFDKTLSDIKKTGIGSHENLSPELRECIVKRSSTKAEDIIASAFLKAETDLGRVIACLETARINMSNSKRESRGKIVSRMLNDSKRPTATNLEFYTKMCHTAEETTLSLLRDRGMFTFAPKPVVPLLFRSPTLISQHTGVHCIRPTWDGSVTCSVAGSWFLSVTHTKNPPPLDTIEEINGYSTFSVKTSLGGGKGTREITTMKDTLTSSITGGFSEIQNELHSTEQVRKLLSNYPSSRIDIIKHCQLNGIPPVLRGEVWGAVLGLPGPDETDLIYSNLNTSQVTIDDEQIAKDVPRCHQYDYLLSSAGGKQQLNDILKGWVIEQNNDLDTPVSHYIQGMASCAAPFVAVNFNNVSKAYASFSNLLKATKYLECDPATGYVTLRRNLYSLIAHHDALLWSKVQQLEIPDDIFLSRLRTHFAHDLPLEKIFVVWDALMLGPSNLIYYLAVALLIQHRTSIMTCTEVTEASLRWKNSILQVNIHDWVASAKELHANTASEMCCPPFINSGLLVNMRCLPCCWLKEMPKDMSNVVVIDTSWRGDHVGNVHLHVPLHNMPSDSLVEAVERKLEAFNVNKNIAGGTHSIVVVGGGYFINQKTDYNSLCLPYFGQKDLSTVLSARGWQGVSATLTQRVHLPITRRAVVLTESDLPKVFAPDIWKKIIDFVPNSDYELLSGVSRGVKILVADRFE